MDKQEPQKLKSGRDGRDERSYICKPVLLHLILPREDFSTALPPSEVTEMVIT